VLDAYIIEEIKKREEERRRKEDAARPRLRIEVPDRPLPKRDPKDGEDEEEDHDRDEEHEPGVIRIDL
jgi:hypothetical protein